jgi:hypothetical protein
MKRILILMTLSVFAAASVAVAAPQNGTMAPSLQKGVGKASLKGNLKAKRPDYVPLASDMFAGVLKVKNRGASATNASKLVLTCKRLRYAGPGGGCPNSPALNRYYDASFDAMAVNIPPLRAGQVYAVSLPMKGLQWSKGKYKFTLKADATAAVAESNERNNLKIVTARR